MPWFSLLNASTLVYRSDRTPEDVAAHASSVGLDEPFPEHNLDNYFEGPEKNLEIDFTRGIGHANGCRAFTREQLDAICLEAKCLILSSVSNEYATPCLLIELESSTVRLNIIFSYRYFRHFDAYVLSESSLFVYSHKILLKTCGTTTLLRCVSLILQCAKQLNLSMEWISYSRKNFTRPSNQLFPHLSFEQETSFLQNIPEAAHGSAYVLGPLTGDHWYVFVADNAKPDRSNYRNIDIKMFEIDPTVTSLFYRSEVASGEEATRESRICDLVPGATVDAHLFDPCGYSMNAQLHESYTTMHITPQAEFSYVSFETNTRLANYAALVRAVLSLFRPGRVVVTMFADESGLVELKDSVFDHAAIAIPRAGTYRQTNFTKCSFSTEQCGLLGNWRLEKDEHEAGSPVRGNSRSPNPIDDPEASVSSVEGM
jgi:S-adenosylmethionine decarboxylase